VLTNAGKTFLAIGLVASIVGIVFGYRTLSALGIAFLLAVVIGRLWIVRRPRVDATRVVVPERVRAGRSARSVLTITNTGRRRTAGGIALEKFGESQLAIEVPSLEPNESVTITTELPTSHRGVFRVGPLDVTRADPFGLVRSGEADEGITNLWVHPVVHRLEPFPVGIARDLEGPESGEALEGGVTFHTLRDYVRGDDLRQIHWRSSARSNKLMVRHNVDTNQPRSLVVLDTRAASYTAEAFEDAVRAAASIVVASMSRSFEFRLLTTDGKELNQQMPPGLIMDRLAEISPSFRGNIEETLDTVRSDLGGVSMALITGAIPPEDLARLHRFRDRFEVITVAQFMTGTNEWERGIPNATVLTASSSEEFARAWNQVTRRS
jgi:uncharacterized protein (DUF58 family)